MTKKDKFDLLNVNLVSGHKATVGCNGVGFSIKPQFFLYKTWDNAQMFFVFPLPLLSFAICK